MTVYKEGEKFACRQCIQGHRVSTCHHEGTRPHQASSKPKADPASLLERPLIHVARKGRPVSQCVHCRGMRKVRQTHIKCDCGERRHSRTTSSESATLTGSDENPCQCGSGKKCSCALKKDHGPSASVPDIYLDPITDRATGKPFMSNRRSESAVPRLRNHYQPALQRSNMSAQDFRFPYKTARPSNLGRSFHAAQRSVDSLPLLNSASSPSNQTCLPPAAFDNQRYLDPRSTYTMSSPLRNQQGLASFGDYAVSPLGRNVTQRTLSPHHPKRHSMNDFGNLLSQFQNENITIPDPSFQSYNAGAQHPQSPEFPFPHSPQQQGRADWSEGNWSERNQRPPPQRTANLNDFTFPPQPALSRSSSPGFMSEGGESMYSRDQPPAYNGTHPTINIDTSWSGQGYDEKSNYGYTPTSYADTPSDFNFNGDAVLPNYSNDVLGTSSRDFDFGEHNEPGFTPVHSRQSSLVGMQQGHALPDRSITHWANASEPMLNTAFKFPNNDFTFSEPFSENADVDEFHWQYGGNHQLVSVEDSPLSQ